MLDNKIRFLVEIMNSDIVIYKKVKKDIENLLTVRNYDKIDGNYSYLISMPIYSFTKEKLEDLYNRQDENKKKMKNIVEKSPSDLLLSDIQLFQ